MPDADTRPAWSVHRWPDAWTWHCHLCDTAGVARTADVLDFEGA